MKREGVVEIGFLELGLDRDRGRLEDFRRVGTDHVDADDLVGRGVEHQFVERALVPAASTFFIGRKSDVNVLTLPSLFRAWPSVIPTPASGGWLNTALGMQP